MPGSIGRTLLGISDPQASNKNEVGRSRLRRPSINEVPSGGQRAERRNNTNGRGPRQFRHRRNGHGFIRIEEQLIHRSAHEHAAIRRDTGAVTGRDIGARTVDRCEPRRNAPAAAQAIHAIQHRHQRAPRNQRNKSHRKAATHSFNAVKGHGAPNVRPSIGAPTRPKPLILARQRHGSQHPGLGSIYPVSTCADQGPITCK